MKTRLNTISVARRKGCRLRSPRIAHKRIVLKITGESLGKKGDPYCTKAFERVIREISDVRKLGVQICIVVGGGNLFRGREGIAVIKKTTADQMGMLATVMNGLALKDALEDQGIKARVMSAIPMPEVAEQFIANRAIRHLEKRRVIICVGGIGAPCFTTDTAAALRAREIGADIVLKATKENGIYDSDPRSNPGAKQYKRIGHDAALKKNLRVMDMTAFSLCLEGNTPIRVFDFMTPGNLRRIITGENIGTLVETKIV